MEIELEHQVLQLDAATHTAHSSEEPDSATFRIVEDMLALAHERGHTVRLFMWGDEARRMTPAGLPGGINGFVDRRMQRYLCARLGPLPGWTMNYGFDLEEWVTSQEVGDWAAYMTAHMGWPHLLAARKRSHPNVPLDANDERPTSGFYDIAVEELDASSNRPVVFDRRFIHLRDGVWDMETTRRALWQFTLAGGAGAVWGHEGTEYPAKEQLRTFHTFWHTRERFDLDLVRANAVTDGWGLRAPDGKRYVAYAEGVSSLDLDLGGAAEPLAAVAVDTLASYAEIDLGVLGKTSHTLSLPHTSDWAIAASAPVTIPALPPAGLLLLATLLLASAGRLYGR